MQLISVNRKARFDYTILETFEAGLVLFGAEVKSMRLHSVNIKEAYVGESSGEIWLFNVNIPMYKGSAEHHEPKRVRKLLLHRRQVNKLIGNIKRKGLTVVPLQLYFNDKGIAKIEIALAKGKTEIDKRETIKKREWERAKIKQLKDTKGD